MSKKSRKKRRKVYLMKIEKMKGKTSQNHNENIEVDYVNVTVNN